MGLLDFIKGEMIDVISWTDDTRDTLVWRYPAHDKAIKNGAQLIVRESQAAQFVHLGEFADLFGPGKHPLTTENIPLMTRLKSWKYGFQSPFKADLYFVSTRLFTGNKWGTPNPIMMRDADFGIVRLRAFGSFDFRVTQPAKFLKEVAGTAEHFSLEQFGDTMRSRVVSVFSDALATAKVPVLDVAARYMELGDTLLPAINPIVEGHYGIELTSFVIENISVPPEVEAAIDKRSSMSAVGNLNDYVKFQMAEGMGKGSSTGGMAAEMAIGIAMAQQISSQQNAGPSTPPAGGLAVPAQAQSQAPSAAPSPASGPSLLSVADAARLLGVSDEDIVATLEKGDLKGKKLGSTWRITRAAIDDFLKS